MNKDGIFDIALFPIPGCVSFPQTIVPLHVFEPRYRQMVEECIEKNRLMGVCHTKSIERFAPRQTKQVSSEEDLALLYKQNLSTFSPEDIFSAGTVEITQRTDDGRYAISIHMLKRFHIHDIIQDTPYKIAKCVEYLDERKLNFNEAEEQTNFQKTFIVNFIKEQLSHLGTIAEKEILEFSQESSINDFTFKLFRFFRMEENLMQDILNSQDPLDRLSQLYAFAVSLKEQKS